MPNTREKEKLTNIVCEAMEDGCIGHCNYPPCFQVECVVNALIANGVTVQKWIPVTERLPEEDKDVLVFGYYHETFQTLICHYRSDFKGQWFTSVAGQQVYEVTHWMPLPEPPKGE